MTIECWNRLQRYKITGRKFTLARTFLPAFMLFLEGTLEEWGELLHSLRHVDVVHGDMGGTFYKVQRLVFCTGPAVEFF